MNYSFVNISESTIEDAINFCWKLCDFCRTKSYPVFEDFHSIKKEFVNRLTATDSFLTGCYKNQELCGVICYFIIPDDKYLQTVGFYVKENDAPAVNAIISHIEKLHHGYTAYVGITFENLTVSKALENLSFLLADNCIDLRLKNYTIKPVERENIYKLDALNAEKYLEYHSKQYKNIYWDAEKIKANLKLWEIYFIKDKEITASVFLRHYNNKTAEIFGVTAPSENECKALLSFALNNVYDMHSDINELIFMPDANQSYAVTAASELGFTEKTHYICYSRCL